jgi:hypothetical protein
MTLPPVAVIILDKIYRRYRHLHQQIEAIWYEITSKYKVIWYEIMSGLAQVEHFFLLFPEIEFTNMSLMSAVVYSYKYFRITCPLILCRRRITMKGRA